MQLDPSIISNTSPRPAPATSFNEAAQNQMQLRQMAQQGEMAKLQMEQAKIAQSDQMQLRDITRQATSIGPDGKPVFNSAAVPGLMGQQGMPGALDAAQKEQEFTIKLESFKMDRAKKVREMAVENRKRMAGLLDSVTDNQTLGTALAEIENDPDLAGAYPPGVIALLAKPWDAESADLVKKAANLYKTPEEQRLQAGQEQAAQHHVDNVKVAVRGQNLAAGRSDRATDVAARRDIRDFEVAETNKLVERNQAFDKLTGSLVNMRAVSDLYDEDGEPTEEGRALGVSDNQMTYISAKVLDPIGAVLTTDYLNQIGGRSWAASFQALITKARAGGTLNPNERVAMLDGVERIYRAQRDVVNQQVHETKNRVWQYGGNPDNVEAFTMKGFSPLGKGWSPPSRTQTQPSYAPTGGAAGAQPPPAAPTGPQPATSPPGTAVTRPVEGGPPVQAPNGKWYVMQGGVLNEVVQ